MTETSDHALTENENEQTLTSLRNEIADLKSRLAKEDDRIATLDVMLNTVMESHNAEVRVYEDLKDKLNDARPFKISSLKPIPGFVFSGASRSVPGRANS